MEPAQTATPTSGAQRTAATELPVELQRQSDRIKEQLIQLKKMLGTISADLTGMSSIMEKYSPELKEEIDKLNSAVEDYSQQADKIYTDVSDQIATYVINLVQNLAALRESIASIAESVKALSSTK